MDNYTRVVLHRPLHSCGDADGAGPRVGTGAAAYDEGRGHSQRVAKEKPTAMNAMPTTRFHWPRSLKTGSAERSSEKT